MVPASSGSGTRTGRTGSRSASRSRARTPTRKRPTDGLVEHGWDHSLGEIVTSIIDAGLRLDFLHEFDFLRWPEPFLVEGADGRYRLPADAGGQLPLFFSLKASKPETR